MYNELSEIKQITNADTLRQMLAQCEDEIMRLAKNAGSCYYWPRDCEGEVHIELSTRACILNHMFAIVTIFLTPSFMNATKSISP